MLDRAGKNLQGWAAPYRSADANVAVSSDDRRHLELEAWEHD
jgi:hypothetical protein